MSMEKYLYRGRVKGGGVFNPLLIPEAMECGCPGPLMILIVDKFIKTSRQLYWIRSDSDNMSMEKDLYRGRVKGGGVFNLSPVQEVIRW